MGLYDTTLLVFQSVAGHKPNVEIVYATNPVLVFCILGVAVIGALWLLAEILG